MLAGATGRALRGSVAPPWRRGSSSSAPPATPGGSPPSGSSARARAGARRPLGGAAGRLAAELGGARDGARPTSTAPNSVFALVEHGRRARLARSGPFVKWGEPAVRAAIAARAHLHRLDRRAGVHPRASSRSSGPPAARAARALLTAMGYDSCRARWRARSRSTEAGDAAVRVDVGYYALGGRPARQRRHGPRSSGATLDARFAFRDGRVQPCAAGRARAQFRGRRQATGRRSRSAAPSTSRCPRPIRGCARSTSTSAGSGRSRGMQAASSAARPSRACPACAGRCSGRRARSPALTGAPDAGHDARRALVDRRRGLRRRRPAAGRGPPSGVDAYAFTAALARLGGRRAPHEG